VVLSTRRLPSLLRVPASLVPRSHRYYEGATTSHLHISGRLFCSLPPPTRSSCLCVRRSAPEAREAPFRPGQLECRLPVVPAISRGRKWDLSGLQVIHPVPLLRSRTPVEPMCPCHGGHIDTAPDSGTTKASNDRDFGAHSRSFGTCSSTLRVSCRHSRARLASGWLAGLCREGVEPSGSLRKVSDHMVVVLLSCHPDAIPIPLPKTNQDRIVRAQS
jgi:hypothetical protein